MAEALTDLVPERLWLPDTHTQISPIGLSDVPESLEERINQAMVTPIHVAMQHLGTRGCSSTADT